MHIQNEQIKLALTEQEHVLGWLRTKRLLVPVKGKLGIDGWEVYTVLFDSQPIEFKRNKKTRERTHHPFGSDVAKALRRSAIIIDPQDFNGEAEFGLDIVERFNLSEGDPVSVQAQENICIYCGLPQTTPSKLGWHINNECQAAKRAAQKANPSSVYTRGPRATQSSSKAAEPELAPTDTGEEPVAVAAEDAGGDQS